MRKSIGEDYIKKIMEKAWNVDTSEIQSDVRFKEFLPWDSMGHVVLLTALEREYNIVIDYETLTELISIPAIINYLKENGYDR